MVLSCFLALLCTATGTTDDLVRSIFIQFTIVIHRCPIEW
eukprot:COSAG01_NODE_12_length_41732_cov_160.472964_4_plen_40_part_00